MAVLGGDGFTLPTDDLASDDIVMTSSRGRAGLPSENCSSEGFGVDRAVSLASAGVSTPTSAIKGEAGPPGPEAIRSGGGRVDRDAQLPTPTRLAGCHHTCHQT